jgi:hypothetical protein
LPLESLHAFFDSVTKLFLAEVAIG